MAVRSDRLSKDKNKKERMKSGKRKKLGLWKQEYDEVLAHYYVIFFSHGGFNDSPGLRALLLWTCMGTWLLNLKSEPAERQSGSKCSIGKANWSSPPVAQPGRT